MNNLVKHIIMSLKNKESNKQYLTMLALYLIMFINEAYMHYEVYVTNYTPFACGMALYYWGMDVTIILLFFYSVTIGRRKLAFILSYCFINIFVLANIGYSRFFNQYFNFDVLGESANFQGTWWITYLPQAFRWSDILLLLTTILFICGLRILKDKHSYKNIFVIFLIYAFCYTCYIGSRVINWHSIEDMKIWLSTNYGEDLHHKYKYNQEYAIVHKGIVRTQIYCNLRWKSHKQKLSASELQSIKIYIEDSNKKLSKLSDSCIVKGKPNIIFIMVESYMAAASKTKINGIEIMPNINSLMREKNSYANLSVTSNRGSGVSSDAQISYFTGLLPLKNEIAVTSIIKNEVIAFPKLLREQKEYNTYITLPTGKNFWHQEEANKKYGIDNVIEFGNKANDFFCQDEELFKKMEQVTHSLREPYLNIILTLSMHGGYDEDFLKKQGYKSPFKYPKSYSTAFRYYLDKCYYTDAQIGKYINYLKKSKQYNNTIIIICSDHEVPKASNQMGCSENLPIIILNSHIAKDKFYQGRINQIDLYPTLLDMFELKTKWRGMGHSLLRDDYTNKITPAERHISNMIINGDYFSQQKR